VKNFLIILFIIFTFFLNCYPQSQSRDSLKTLQDTTGQNTPNLNIIKRNFSFSNTSDSITVDDIIWNDKKNFSEALAEFNGFINNFLTFNGRNEFSYNTFDSKQIGVFRDGIQINDLLFGGFDNENISINEISKIELVSNVLSFLYGTNSRGKAINIISKEEFFPYVFTQLRYSQDRYDELSADVRFNIPFSKKFQIVIGAANRGTNGRYKNSDVGVWNARAKINYYPSNRFNLKFNFHLTSINRQLNEGLVNSTLDTLIEPILANVNNPTSYEKISNLDLDASLLTYLLDKKNVTTLTVHTANQFREYRDGENIVGYFNRIIFNNFHSIRYEALISQSLNVNILKNVSSSLFLSGEAVNDIFRYNFINPDTTVRFNFGDYENYYKVNRYTAKSRLDMKIYRLNISAAFRADYLNDNLYSQYGVEGNLNIFPDKNDLNISLNGGINSTKEGIIFERLLYPDQYLNLPYYSDKKNTYIEFGGKIHYKNFHFTILQYGYDYENTINLSSGNYLIAYLSKYFDLKFSADRFRGDYLPDLFFKSDISFHNYFFDNHLNLHIGFNIKYSTKYSPMYYNEYMNKYMKSNLPEKEFFNIDAYLSARIGSANISFTFANILDRLNYTSSIYPFDDRGGVLNSLARFSIVWDFKY